VIAVERGARPLLDVFVGRFRAACLRFRGASLEPKIRLGRSVSILRPWRVRIGERTEVEARVFFKIVNEDASLNVGDYCFIGRNVEFDVSELISVGNHVLIAPNCFITDHSHNFRDPRNIDSQGCTSKPVKIHDDVWIGASCVVLSGVTIGRGAVVAANSVVTSDVAPMSIVAGSPARTIGQRLG
jgi:acetyltransferase-like isoleucine patch superfamily enzyme